VRYVYEKSSAEPDLMQMEAFALTQEALAPLPSDWFASLSQAAIEGDLDGKFASTAPALLTL